MAAGLALAGARWAGAMATAGDGALARLVLASLAGWLSLHLLLTLLQLCGVRWTLPVVAAACAALVLAQRRLIAAPTRRRPRLPSDLGWGDGLAFAALAVYTICALSLWIAIPDFVYHWGIKGERYFLAGGVDYAFLASPANWVVHPDYPNLLPELFAVSAMAARRFSEPAMMLWSPICFALLLAAAREALRRAGTGRFLSQAALAILALALAAYGIAAPSAGGADWLIVLALGAALPPLLAPAGGRGAAQIGLIAAVAAAAKIEGIALAGALVAVYTVRLAAARRRQRRAAAEPGALATSAAPPSCAAPAGWAGSVGPAGSLGTAGSVGSAACVGSAASAGSAGSEGTAGSAGSAACVGSAAPATSPYFTAWTPLRAAVALCAPAAAAVLPWAALVRHHHLFLQFNSGPLQPARLPRVAVELVTTLPAPEWHGFAWLVALAPLLALDRRLRAIAAVICMQALFYLYVFLSVRIDPLALIQATLSRLVMHLLPAVLVGIAIALQPGTRQPPPETAPR